jgi:MYXO-CTERM domain-containing protein
VDGGSAVDAGVRDAGVRDAGARDASPDAADFDAGGGTPATEGCACRAAGSTPARGAGLAWFGLAIVGALVVRRRR